MITRAFTGARTHSYLIVNPGTVQRTAARSAAPFQTTGQFSDVGGDDAPTCVRLKASYDGRATARAQTVVA